MVGDTETDVVTQRQLTVRCDSPYFTYHAVLLVLCTLLLDDAYQWRWGECVLQEHCRISLK